MLKSRPVPTNGAALDKLVIHVQGLTSIGDDVELATATTNLEGIRKRRADAAAHLEDIRRGLEQAESDAADALAAGRDYDERGLKAAHLALSSAESQLRVLSLAVARAEQQLPETERAARDRVIASLRLAHEGAVKELDDKLAAAATASGLVRTIEHEARRLLGVEGALAAGIQQASWDELREADNGRPSRLAEWRRLVRDKVGVQV